MIAPFDVIQKAYAVDAAAGRSLTAKAVCEMYCPNIVASYESAGDNFKCQNCIASGNIYILESLDPLGQSFPAINFVCSGRHGQGVIIFTNYLCPSVPLTRC